MASLGKLFVSFLTVRVGMHSRFSETIWLVRWPSLVSAWFQVFRWYSAFDGG